MLWAHASPQPKRHLDQFSRVCTDDCGLSLPILYNGLPVSPSNVECGKITQSFHASTNNFDTIKSLSVRSKQLIFCRSVALQSAII